MWGQKAARIAELEARNTYLAEQLEVARQDQTPQEPAPKRDSGLANQLHARTLQRDDAIRARQEAEAQLARIRGGGLYRQIRAAANRSVGDDAYDSPARAVRDFARDLETWLPEDTGTGECEYQEQVR